MKALLKITMLIIFTITGSKCQDVLLSGQQVDTLFDMLISEIESIDAEAIKTRNKSKEVKWKEWVQVQKLRFQKAKNIAELKNAFSSFNMGFVNAHARSKFLYPLEDEQKPTRQASIKIGYTFPKTHFFDLDSKQTITKINNVEIAKIFHFYNNFQCRGNSEINCAKSFKIEFERGTLEIDDKEIRSVSFENGEKVNINYKEVEPRDRYKEITNAIDTKKLYPSWDLIKAGYKVGIWKKDEIALVKIQNFVYPMGSDGGLRCSESASDSTQCGDVRIIRNALFKIATEVDHLILDVQDNPGGNENSRFIAELCPKPFKDLAVQYRKTTFLEDPKLRNHLFYYSDRTENWYQNIKSNGIYKDTPKGDFFPAIADFCQGSEECDLDFIEPNLTAQNEWESITVLVNEGTASSGDDFVYRMKSYAGAKIVGQTQSADLSYSLVTVFFYLDPYGNVRKKYYGNNAKDLEVEGTPLLTFDIPFSRSVDEDGNLLQGSPLKLDLEVPLTKENFSNRQNCTLEKAVEEFVKTR